MIKMISKKKLHKIGIFYFMIFLIFTFTEVNAASINITYWDMDMELDDVVNYDGVRLTVFFLPTCSHCINELPVLKQIDSNYNVSIFMLDITLKSTNQSLIDFKNTHVLSDNWTFGYTTSDTNEYFDLFSVPRIIILDNVSRVVDYMRGEQTYGTLESKVLDAINYNTENYNPDFNDDPSTLVRNLFIVLGVGVAAVVVYFLVKTFVNK
jgi:thiol-disulfide isomerase/thioredoxin